TDDEVAVWALAHGVPDAPSEGGWNRRALEGLAGGARRAGPGGGGGQLLEAGGLARAGPGAASAADFSAPVPLAPLLARAGADHRRPNAYGLGVIGQAAALVDTLAYEVWQWAPQSGSLWRACEVFTTAQRGGAAATEAETRAELGPFLLRVQVLLSYGAAYLDL